MAAAAIFTRHPMMTGQPIAGSAANPLNTTTGGTSNTSGSGSSDGNSATISANDFLTLLVTEMQNQDPTADTDPNEYVDQLVQVNSLEQLIDINQTLSTDLTSAAPSSTGGVSGTSAPTAQNQLGLSPAAAQNHGLATHTSTATHNATLAASPAAATPNAIQRAPGNLSVPAAGAASRRVAHALDGRSHAQPQAAVTSTSQ